MMCFSQRIGASEGARKRANDGAIRVLLVAEDEQHREVLIAAFRGDARFHIVDVADLAGARAPLRKLDFDVVVGYATSRDSCRRFRVVADQHPEHLCILLMTPHPSETLGARADTVERVAPLIEVLHERVTRCERPGPMKPEATKRDRERLARLSAAEMRVLALTAEGHSIKEIGRRLHRSAKTVANQRHSIMAKTDLRDRVTLTRFAIRVGLIEA